MDSIVLVSIIGAIFLGTFVKSAFGFGDALVAMPILALLIDVQIAAPVVTALCALTSARILLKEYSNVKWKQIIPALIAAGIFIPLGVYFGKYGDAQIVRKILGGFLLLFGTYSLLGFHVRKIESNLIGIPFGIITGFFSGAFSIGGPPVVVYGKIRGWSPIVFRASLQGFFVPMNLFITANHIWIGNYNLAVLGYIICVFPLSLIAVFLGKKLNQKLGENVALFSTYIYIILIIMGISLFF